MKNEGLLKSYNVDVEGSLQVWGDAETYEENLKDFRNSLDEKIANLEYYKNNGDWNNYAIIAHSMKSEAKYLGFMNDAEIFLQHELKGKAGDAEYINNNFVNIKDAIDRIAILLDEYFNPGSNTKRKILIADDSSIMLNFIDKHIKDEYDVIRATTGKEAIEQIRNHDIYAILLDLNMPGLNGFQVLDYLKERDLIEKIPVVIITGDDTEETIKRAFSYPILDVLNKPFKDENIRRVLVEINSFYEKN